MRTVHVTAIVNLVLNLDEGLEVQEAMGSIEVRQVPWTSRGCTESFDIEDATIANYSITDSR